MGETIIYISLPLKKDRHLIFCICIYSSHISIHTKNQLPSSSGLITNSQLHISDFCHFGPNEKIYGNKFLHGYSTDPNEYSHQKSWSQPFLSVHDNYFQICRNSESVKKKSSGHIFARNAFIRNQMKLHQMQSILIQFHSIWYKTVSVTFFFDEVNNFFRIFIWLKKNRKNSINFHAKQLYRV